MSLYQNFLVISLYLTGLFQKIGFYNRLQQSNTYRAAIVEYGAFTGNTTVDFQADNYIKLIAKAAKYDTDIIVFPECGLEPDLPLETRKDYVDISTFVPDPKDKVIPYLDVSGRYAAYLKKLSRTAKKYQIYVTVNVDEMEECDPKIDVCHPDKLNLYNTNVVFDRNGTVIARYRKYNLFDEPLKNITKTPEFSYFDTDFSVRFGTFICFDILFQQPALNLTRNFNITDFVYPTEWYSSFPFESALQMQQAWAFKEHVNLLAANLNYPKDSGSGSGIFHADKNLKNSMFYTIEENVTTLLISDVVKRNFSIPEKLFTETKQFEFDHKGRITERLHVQNPLPNSKFDNYKFLFTQNFSNYTGIKIDPILRKQTHQLCAEDLCCKISITMQTCSPMEHKNFYQYHFVIFNGIVDYDWKASNGQLGTGICGLVGCLNSSLSSCGEYFDVYDSIDWYISFKKIKIEAIFNSTPNITDFPNSVQPGFKPLNKDSWEYERKNESHVEFTLVKPTKKILGFNINVRNFTKDIPRV